MGPGAGDPGPRDAGNGTATPALVLLDGRRQTDAGLATLSLIADARRSLAEARTLPDVRPVMEAASVAVDAAQRATRLAEGQRLAAEVVEAANDAANDAAAIRNEAQARAGEMLREMARRGERDSGGRGRVGSRPATQLGDLGVTKSESSRWQQVAAVPAAVRQEYHDSTKAARGEVSTAGLLRYARSRPSGAAADGGGEGAAERGAGRPGPAEDDGALRQLVRGAHQELARAAELRKFDAWLLVRELGPRERRRLRSTVAALSAWLAEVIQALDSASSENEEVM
jgi:hypothetical protein